MISSSKSTRNTFALSKEFADTIERAWIIHSPRPHNEQTGTTRITSTTMTRGEKKDYHYSSSDKKKEKTSTLINRRVLL